MVIIRSATQIAAVALFTISASCAAAQDGEPSRWFPPHAASEHIPIRQIRLSDGTTRYAIPFTLAGRRMLAGLDTGSVGLRLLPRAQEGLASSEAPVSVDFGSGVELDGVYARGPVAIGRLADDLLVQKVTEVKYLRSYNPAWNKPTIDSFGVMGDGLPGEGFEAIIGIRPVPDVKLANPLMQLGVHRWIVTLPQPGATEPGELVLDPTPAEMVGFHPLPPGAAPGQVTACLFRFPASDGYACGPTMFDTGAPGLNVVDSTLNPDAASGDKARMTFARGTPDATALLLRLDDARQMTRFKAFQTTDMTGTQIKAGVTPYLAYDVLYDADRGTMSVRARDAYPGGPIVLW